MSCPERPSYISNANSLSGLESLLDDTLQEIYRNFGIGQPRGTSKPLPLINSNGQVLLTLPDNIRIWKLERKNWNHIAPPTVRGRYYSIGNKIILNDDKWCRKTLIHESLHSVSIFSHPCNLDSFQMTLLFAEGITEFMTGLLLWREHDYCYENWRCGNFQQLCSLSYPKETRTFFAFCGCVNTQCLIDLYFNTQTDVFSNAWVDFIADIRRDTGKNFKDVLGDAKRFGLMPVFKIECERQFKKKFRKLQKSLDYNKI